VPNLRSAGEIQPIIDEAFRGAGLMLQPTEAAAGDARAAGLAGTNLVGNVSTWEHWREEIPFKVLAIVSQAA
jgi:hypothetical protein